MTDGDFLFEADDAEFDLVLGENGEPIDGGLAEIRVDRLSPAKHSQWGDVRIYAVCSVVGSERRVLKVWGLACGGGCGRRTGARCANPKIKTGAAGFLRRDFAVALDHRPTSRQRFSKADMIGRTFIAPLMVCKDDDETGEERPRSQWYSKVGPFVRATDR